MNRLVSVKGVDGKTTRYSYDALGRRIATEGAKETSSYTYDEVGNLVSQTTTGAYDLALSYMGQGTVLCPTFFLTNTSV